MLQYYNHKIYNYLPSVKLMLFETDEMVETAVTVETVETVVTVEMAMPV